MRHQAGETTYAGPEAVRILGRLLVRRNGDGGSLEDIASALELIEHIGGTEQVLKEWLKPGATDVKDWRLHKIPKPLALAFEIAAHEERERRAVQGELALLKTYAKEAQVVAGIAKELD